MIETRCTTTHGVGDRFYGFARRDELGWHTQPRHGHDWKTCAYCGSLPPDVLLELRTAGRLLSRDMADWKYGWPHKLYVDIKPADPDLVHVLGGLQQATHGSYAPGGENYREPDPDLVRWDLLTDEQRAICDADGCDAERYDQDPTRHFVRFGTRSSLHAKYYLIHGLDEGLTGEQREKLAHLTGYWIEDVGDGRFRWRMYDYSAAAQ